MGKLLIPIQIRFRGNVFKKSKESTAEPVLSIQSETEEDTLGGDELSERDCIV